MSRFLPTPRPYSTDNASAGRGPYCPVCGARIRPTYLLCRTHWYRVTRATRAAVYAAIEAWADGRLSLADLRKVQAEAVREARMAK